MRPNQRDEPLPKNVDTFQTSRSSVPRLEPAPFNTAHSMGQCHLQPPTLTLHQRQCTTRAEGPEGLWQTPSPLQSQVLPVSSADPVACYINLSSQQQGSPQRTKITMKLQAAAPARLKMQGWNAQSQSLSFLSRWPLDASHYG